jgi:hypothetical protein
MSTKPLFILLIVLCFGSLAHAQPFCSNSGNGGPASCNSALFGNTAVQVCHAEYSFANDGGGTGLITPANNCTIPAKSILYGLVINWTTAGTGTGNTTSIGVTGTGGGAAALLAATAVASLTGLVPGIVTFAAPIKITTAGTVTLTTAVAALTAGVCEIYVFFVVSPT